MSEIAIYYDNIIICWSSIIISAAIITGSILGMAFYFARNKYSFAGWLYIPLATCASLYLSRIIHWYCHMEQYEDFMTSITRFDSGDYCMVGVLIATWIVAALMSLTHLVSSKYKLLDAFAPGLAFIIGIIRLSAIYNSSCRGKILINNPSLWHLPIADGALDSTGNMQYRLATYFLSFIGMMLITIIITIFNIVSRKRRYKKYMVLKSAQKNKGTKDHISSKGHVYRMFLLLYSGLEIVIDSTRYDASHLYFSGEKLASLNKGASFMGLSQFTGAICVIYLFVYYIVLSFKTNGRRIKNFILIGIYIIGFAMAGVSEYLVQRYGSMYATYYSTQIFGVLLVIITTYMAYRTCILLPNQE